MPSQIDTLLRLVPDHPDQVLTHLTTHPTLASSADASGYTLLHAATSYNQLPLLRALVTTYNVSVNITDSDNETPLFVAETLETVRCLVEELGADVGWRNDEGESVGDKVEGNLQEGEPGEWALIKGYLEHRGTGAATTNGDSSHTTSRTVDGGEDVHPPPPLPQGIQINMGTMQEAPGEGEDGPDPEFRRRIEELAAREDFQGEEAQSELRQLVQDAIGGVAIHGHERDVRRRVE